MMDTSCDDLVTSPLVSLWCCQCGLYTRDNNVTTRILLKCNILRGVMHIVMTTWLDNLIVFSSAGCCAAKDAKPAPNVAERGQLFSAIQCKTEPHFIHWHY